MNQKQVWNNLAKEWHDFKTKKKKTDHDVFYFLKKQQGKVLDLGSGSGRYLSKIKNGQMYLVDFSKEMIKFAKEISKKEKIKAEFLVNDISKLEFKDNFFDAAICIASLHCVKTKTKRRKAVKELYRVLKPKAKAMVSVWNKDTKRFKNSPKERFVRWLDKGSRYYYLYNPEEIYKEFTEAGFKIIKKEMTGRNITFFVQKH